MIQIQKPKLRFVFSIVLVFALIVVFPGQTSGQIQSITNAQEKLEEISDEERLVLQELFILLQEIEEMDRQEKTVTKDMEILQVEIKDFERKIQSQQKQYDEQLEILEQVLISYQRRGAASYLETLLKAKDLTAFLRSLNIIRDLSRNSEELLTSLEEGKRTLEADKEIMAGNLTLMENKKKELQQALDKKLELKKQQEAYLHSLAEGREYYQEQLDNLQQTWDDIKILFSQIIGEFARITNEGRIPLEELDLTFAFPAIKGTITEKMLNRIVKEQSNLPEMIFHFRQGKAEIEVPEKHLSVAGTFMIEGKSVLKFKAEEGRFYGMPLEAVSLEELFKEEHLAIDFNTIDQSITLRSIEIMEGFMEFRIAIF